MFVNMKAQSVLAWHRARQSLGRRKRRRRHIETVNITEKHNATYHKETAKECLD